MGELQILYDGDCPFCANYVRLTRLRNSIGHVEIINARSEHPLVPILGKQFNLNNGMLACYNGEYYYGADCVHLLSMLSSRVGWMNSALSALFSNKWVARLSYPLLRAGRNATLRAIGRKQIES